MCKLGKCAPLVFNTKEKGNQLKLGKMKEAHHGEIGSGNETKAHLEQLTGFDWAASSFSEAMPEASTSLIKKILSRKRPHPKHN
jgi:hypothetical protein